jgi:hypothetical protein
VSWSVLKASDTLRRSRERGRVVRDRGEAFERFSRAVDGPLTVLALVMIPLIVLPLVMDLSPGTESAFLAIDYLIWARCSLPSTPSSCT